MKETPQHILEDCQLFNEERQKLRNAIQELKLNWPGEKWKFITKDVYPHFRQFTRSVLQIKEQRRRTVLQETRSPLQQGTSSDRRSTQAGK
jgi:hypothetical protein